MLGNLPILRYTRHHHWLWILRRLQPSGKLLIFIGLLWLILLVLLVDRADGAVLFLIAIVLAGLSLTEGLWLAYVWLDWRTRHIHLYSDGRMEYIYGILFRAAKSASMRFGVVRYHYHDRIGTWLDCADLMLPFDAGIVPDIPDFQEFWEIAQGRH